MGWFFWSLVKSCDVCEVLPVNGDVPIVSLILLLLLQIKVLNKQVIPKF